MLHVRVDIVTNYIYTSAQAQPTTPADPHSSPAEHITGGKPGFTLCFKAPLSVQPDIVCAELRCFCFSHLPFQCVYQGLDTWTPERFLHLCGCSAEEPRSPSCFLYIPTRCQWNLGMLCIPGQSQ